MRPEPILDLSKLDLDEVLLDGEELDEYLPQFGQMRHLDRLTHYEEGEYVVGVKDVKADEFWVDGHFPGWPVLPGVILIEAMAQLASVLWRKTFEPGDRLMMFGGLDNVRFRGASFPGDKLILVGKQLKLHMRMSKFQCQAFKNGKIVCEALITGVLGPSVENAKKLAEG